MAVMQAATRQWYRLIDRREVRWPLVLLLLGLAFSYPAIVHGNNPRIYAATEAEVFVLLALGLNIVVGFAGLLDLGYAAFFAIGAYTLALLGSTHFSVSHPLTTPLVTWGSQGIHVNFFLLIPLAAIFASLSGIAFGAPTLRLRGDYLAIVTLGFGEIVPKVIENLGPDNSFGWPDITGGVNRLTGLDAPPDIHIGSFSLPFSGSEAWPWYYMGFAFVVFSIAVISSLRNSRLGRAWAAIREDEVAAAHMGINITRARLSAFALGAAFSGFAGILEASRLGSVDYTQFGFNVSVTILVMVIFGGMGSIAGAIVGGIIIAYLNVSWLDNISAAIHNLGSSMSHSSEPLHGVGTWLATSDPGSARPLFFGIILLLVMLLRPQGLIPSRTRAAELHPETSGIAGEENVELSTAREA